MLVNNELVSRLDIVSHQVSLTSNGKEAAEKQLIDRRITDVLNQKGDVAAKTQGNSECRFNGLDQPDEVELGDGGEPEGPEGYDDPLWSLTPAGANSGGTVRVQTGGQLVALGLPLQGIQGSACNPTAAP